MSVEFTRRGTFGVLAAGAAATALRPASARSTADYTFGPAAGCYSCVLHYLKTVSAMGVDQAKATGRATVAAMTARQTDDPLFGRNTIRADGRLLNPMYLFQVKTPAESKYAWDYLTVVHTLPGDQAFRPMLPACDFTRA